MKFKKYSTETVAEMLSHLADNEEFKSLKGFPGMTKSSVKDVLHSLSNQLKEIADQEPVIDRESVAKKMPQLGKVMQDLTPQEEKLLFRSFRIS